MSTRARLRTPVVLVNYKVYAGALGKNAIRLTKVLEAAGESFPEATVAVCPSHPDLAAVLASTRLPVFAQSVSGDKPGAGTGKVLPESLVDLGVTGSLVNHAECRVPEDAVKLAVDRLSAAGLVSVVCTADDATTKRLASSGPSYLAVEPPELIGGDISVTTADPGVVQRSVEAARRVDEDAQLLCGAGVKTGRDVAVALSLGTQGVLVASGVVSANDPGAALAGLLEGTRANAMR